MKDFSSEDSQDQNEVPVTMVTYKVTDMSKKFNISNSISIQGLDVSVFYPSAGYSTPGIASERTDFIKEIYYVKNSFGRHRVVRVKAQDINLLTKSVNEFVNQLSITDSLKSIILSDSTYTEEYVKKYGQKINPHHPINKFSEVELREFLKIPQISERYPEYVL